MFMNDFFAYITLGKSETDSLSPTQILVNIVKTHINFHFSGKLRSYILGFQGGESKDGGLLQTISEASKWKYEPPIK